MFENTPHSEYVTPLWQEASVCLVNRFWGLRVSARHRGKDQGQTDVASALRTAERRRP